MSRHLPARIDPAKPLESRIHLVRGRRIILAPDIALLYGVPTKRLNQQVGRNRRRFPSDFMFRLTAAEALNLRSQIATSSSGWGGARYRPLAFTEQGVAMLAGVLNSPCAIRVNIEIMRAFAKLRELLVAHEDLARRIDELEAKYDGQFAAVFEAFREIVEPAGEEEPDRPRIGFRPRRESGKPDQGRQRA